MHIAHNILEEHGPLIHGCNELEDWDRDHRCCDQMYHEFEFESSDHCREFFDHSLITYHDHTHYTYGTYSNNQNDNPMAWVIGIAVVMGILLIFTICWCWRRGNKTNTLQAVVYKY